MRSLALSLVAGLLSIACNEENPPPPWRHDAVGGECRRVVYYLDEDGDGYGGRDTSREACAQPPGYVVNDLDCDDLDPAAHPGQAAFFNVPTKGGTSFDYDCDGTAQPQHATVVSCVVVAVECQGDGWVTAVPACGQPGTFAVCSKQAGGGPPCSSTTSSRTQSCR